jgi:hypothetical protein
MKIEFDWHNYKYLPYEKRLARKELENLSGSKVSTNDGRITIEAGKDWQSIACRTTYFQAAYSNDGHCIVPQQALLEASANGGVQKSRGTYKPPTLKRQSTRYSAHGLHEYRGKFNPQIVRAIGNILNLKADEWVLDPFCGSGTTLLEAAHIGWNGVGVEVNPLGVEISRAKVASVHISPAQLQESCDRLLERLSRRVTNTTFETHFSERVVKKVGGTRWSKRLPNLPYLHRWFTESVLVQVSAILGEINELPSPAAKLIFRVILSDILRSVSLQDPADLRIRRTKQPTENAPAIPTFLKAITAQTSNILKARRFMGKIRTRHDVVLGDVRDCAEAACQANSDNLFDAAITSPPYVAALPYIDTQRLSLATLGLVEAKELRAKERELIGNREITNEERHKLELAIDTNSDDLPFRCLSLIRKMNAAVDKGKDGFRRQNMPALTYQYCRDMGLMFSQVRRVLKRGAAFVLVVGVNRTRLGDTDFVIDTPDLLGSLAMHHGFTQRELIELNTYHRFDIHQANSIRSEVMLTLRA